MKEHCNFEFTHQWAWGTDRAGCQMQRTLSRIYQLIANWMEKNITWDGRQLNRAINLGFASSRLHGCNERGSKIFVLERKGAIRIDHNSSVAEGVTNLIVQGWFYGRLNLFLLSERSFVSQLFLCDFFFARLHLQPVRLFWVHRYQLPASLFNVMFRIKQWT